MYTGTMIAVIGNPVRNRIEYMTFALCFRAKRDSGYAARIDSATTIVACENDMMKLFRKAR